MNILKDYDDSITSTDLPADFFSNNCLNLVSLSHALYCISKISQQYQEIEFSNELYKRIDSNSKHELSRNVILLHKNLTHFIKTNKDSNE